MKIMKKLIQFLSLILTVATLLTFTACDVAEPPQGGSEQNGGSVDNTTPPEDDKPSIPDTPPVETLEEKKAKIKTKVLEIMNDETSSREEPEELFAAFCGDFCISSITTSGSLSSDVKRAYLKDGIYAVENRDGSVYYDLVYKNHWFSLEKDKVGELSLIYCEPIEGSVAPASLFEYLAIDISDFYDGESDSDCDSSYFPPLTASKLTVSDDLKTCSFSDSYMTELTNRLFEDIGFLGTPISNDSSGVYKVEDNCFELIISAVTDTSGEVRIKVTVGDSETEGYSRHFELQCNVDIMGEITPIDAILTVKNVKYDGNKAVSATFESSLVTIGATGSVMGYDYTMDMYDGTVCVIDISHPDAKSIKLTQKSKQEIRFSTGTTTESSETTLDCVFGSTPKLEFSSSMSDDSGKTSASMSSNDVSLSAPSDVDIPAEILQLVKQEYEKIR